MSDDEKKTLTGMAINCGNGFPPPGRFLTRTEGDDTHFYRILRYDDTRVYPGLGSRRYVEVERIAFDDLPPVPQPFARFEADDPKEDPFELDPDEAFWLMDDDEDEYEE